MGTPSSETVLLMTPVVVAITTTTGLLKSCQMHAHHCELSLCLCHTAPLLPSLFSLAQNGDRR